MVAKSKQTKRTVKVVKVKEAPVCQALLFTIDYRVSLEDVQYVGDALDRLRECGAVMITDVGIVSDKEEK